MRARAWGSKRAFSEHWHAAVLGMECWSANSTKFGQRQSLPFSIMNGVHILFSCRFNIFIYRVEPSVCRLFFFLSFLVLYLFISAFSCPLSASIHSSQMSLQFDLLYCCNKVIHLFGRTVVNCRQINICCTIYLTSNYQWLPFSKDHRRSQDSFFCRKYFS